MTNAPPLITVPADAVVMEPTWHGSHRKLETRSSQRFAASRLVLGADYRTVSVSVQLLLARIGSVTPLGRVTVAVSEMVPRADPLIVPLAL